MMFGVMDGDNHILQTVFHVKENAQHYADTLNEAIRCKDEFTVIELNVAD